MSRAKKLLTVAVVLVIGIALAWPFRKKSEFPVQNLSAPLPQKPADHVAESAQASDTHTPPGSQPHVGQSHVVARMASRSEQAAEPKQTQRTTSFDLAHHPALAGQLASAQSQPVTPAVPPPSQSPWPIQATVSPQGSRPAYATTTAAEGRDPGAQWPEEVLHVIQNGDTLEKLAKRYLGDPSRALEIFDLNRDQLTNPHLLPIDVKLRIPVDPSRMVD